MIALALAAALAVGAPAPDPSSVKGGKPAQGAAAPAEAAPAPAPPEPAAPAEAEAVADADVMGFLSLSHSTASRDGAVKLPWDGPGAGPLKLSWDALDKRNEQLQTGDMMARSLVQVVRNFFETEGGVDPDQMRARLANMIGSPTEEARTAYLDAISWEERRLFFIQRAVSQADAEGVVIPGIDPALVSRRIAAVRNGAVKKALLAQVDGYRDLASGLIAYVDGDTFGALQRVRSAAGALPDLAIAHAFLGSLYFLFDQKDAAVIAWRRALELDPTNEAVKQALLDYGRKAKQAAKKQ